jgi:hypothetical protein
MRTNARKSTIKALRVAALFFASAGVLVCQSTAVKKVQTDDAANFQDFSLRVQNYVKLQRKVESKLPALKPTDLPEMIAAHQQALARMIREARPNAKAGDIFTPSICEAFRHAIRDVFANSPADKALIPLGRTEPLKEMHLQVNGIYPDAVPYTAVSPALLAKFPKLPDDVAYRIVVRELVLIDVRSSMIVDLAHEVIPAKP